METFKKKLVAFIATLAVLGGLLSIVGATPAHAGQGSTAGGPTTCGGWTYLGTYSCTDASDGKIYFYYGGVLVSSYDTTTCSYQPIGVWSNMQSAYGYALPNPYPYSDLAVRTDSGSCGSLPSKAISNATGRSTMASYAAAGLIHISLV